MTLSLAAAVAALALHVPVEREIAGGEEQRFGVELEADSALEVHVDQVGVDVVIDVLDAGGARVTSVDGHTGSWGTETVFLLAKDAGPRTLVVRALAADGHGHTRTELVLQRRATREDRERAAARDALDRAWKSRAQFRYEEARRDGEAALLTLNESALRDVPERTDALELLGYVYDETGLYDRGAEAFREVVARRRALGAPPLVVLEMESNLAWLEMGGGHYEEAAARFSSVVRERRALAATQTLLPNGSLSGLGQSLARLGRLEGAARALEEAIAAYVAGPPSRRPDAAGPMSELGRVLLRQGRVEEAEAACRHALELRRDGAWGDLGRASDLRCLGSADAARKSWDAGEKRLGEALDLCAKRRGAASLCAADALEDLGRLEAAKADAGAARSRFEEALRIKTAVLPRTHPEVRALEKELEALRRGARESEPRPPARDPRS